MGKKATVDINTLFTGDLITEHQRHYVIKSDLLPVVAAIYNASEGALKCGLVNDSLNTLTMVNSTGTPAMYVRHQDDVRRGRVITTGIMFGYVRCLETPDITSARASYIVGQIKKPYMKNRIESAVIAADSFCARLLRNFIDESKRISFKNTKVPDQTDLSDESVLQVVTMIAEGRGVSSLPPASYQAIIDAYHKYQSKFSEVKAEIERFVDFWSRDKWAMLIDPYAHYDGSSGNAELLNKHGFMLFRISGNKTKALADALCRDKSLFDCNDFKSAIEQVGYFRGNPESIQDPELRASLLPSLMMFKVHSADDGFLTPVASMYHRVYDKIGAIYYEGSWNAVPYLVFE